MALIKSISGIRGTIGGIPGFSLTPIDTVKFASAYGQWVKDRGGSKVVIGRDARISGPVVNSLVTSSLISLGLDVVDIGLSTTPTVELAVVAENADGGIVLTASHNPINWNALKLLNERGEFLSGDDGAVILKLADSEIEFNDTLNLGTLSHNDRYIEFHSNHVCNLEYVRPGLIREKNLKVVVDVVNSTGGLFVPALLEALGVKEYHLLNEEVNGHFAHNPEPLPENLNQISDYLRSNEYDVGLVVDPDVDRLAIVCEDGSFFGEEYTLVAVADHVLSKEKGNTVSNLSSSRALWDVTESHGGTYQPAAVGEVNVVTKMKETNAVIGGEGNGGVIYPASHYGRDALVGIGLFLTLLAERNCSVSELRKGYPPYFITKTKISLEEGIDLEGILESIASDYLDESINKEDGIRIDFKDSWVHLRKSNTEPIIRVIGEASTKEKSEQLTYRFLDELKEKAR